MTIKIKYNIKKLIGKYIRYIKNLGITYESTVGADQVGAERG
jgi:hypothetical protein